MGGAIGLGNIWRFPYEMAENGGGAFLLVYLGFVLLLGVPVMLAEFVIGRGTHMNATDAIRQLAPGKRLHYFAHLGTVSSLLVTGFYTVVAGWIVRYLFASAKGLWASGVVDHQADFATFVSSPEKTLFYSLLVLILTSVVMSRGVHKGIEKFCNVLMPILGIMLLVLCGRACMLPGTAEGLRFMFVPNFSAINGEVLLSALGQAFFSLALGCFGLATYAAYFTDETKLTKSAFTIAGLDTLVAVMAGVMIFPVLFTAGGQSVAGPELLFVVMPEMFDSMPLGQVWEFIFFGLLFFAAISSLFCINEIALSFIENQYHQSRRKATLWQTGIAGVFVVLATLSFNALSDVTPGGKTLFDWFDYLASNWLMPIGGLFIAIFVGWQLPRSYTEQQLGTAKKRGLKRVIFWLIRYVAPVAIFLVFVAGIVK